MGLPTVVVNDFYLEVTRGNVNGFAAKELLGMNTSVDGTEDIWNQGGSIVQATTAALLYVSSSDAGDITQSVIITGVDSNYDEITENITLKGQTRVAGTKAFLRVNDVALSAAAAGKVYVFYLSTVTAGVPDDLTKVQAAIDIAEPQAYNAIYTVPRNKKWYLTSLRYRSSGSTTTHDVILSIIRKVFGGINEVVDTVKYTDLGATNYTDNQIQLTDRPVLFPAKSEIRFTASLAGGTDLDVALEVHFVAEDIVAIPLTVPVLDKSAYLAKLALLGHTLISQNYLLIGLDVAPAGIPSVANIDNLLATIIGATNYRVAADTEVVFDPVYFVSGKLIVTNKKAIFTIMRCVDNTGLVDYVQAPVNTVINLSNVKKTNYLA